MNFKKYYYLKEEFDEMTKVKGELRSSAPKNVGEFILKQEGERGLKQLEDVMEKLLGLEIMDESDDRPDMQQLARERWEMRAAKLGILPINGLD